MLFPYKKFMDKLIDSVFLTNHLNSSMFELAGLSRTIQHCSKKIGLNYLNFCQHIWLYNAMAGWRLRWQRKANLKYNVLPTLAGCGSGTSAPRTGNQLDWGERCSLKGPSKLAIMSDILKAHMAEPRRLFLKKNKILPGHVTDCRNLWTFIYWLLSNRQTNNEEFIVQFV